MCSFDARSEGQSGDSLWQEGVMVQRRKQKPLVGRAQWEINRPPGLGNESRRSFEGRRVGRRMVWSKLVLAQPASIDDERYQNKASSLQDRTWQTS